ncbi:hypothetical protein EV178_000916 [Coemansia sp. RSA 1646]|nr:hypothetical protein EV178_000916 [Coemansia sp. RSA 1646]
MSADQSARSSRLSSEIIHESCSSMPVTAGASPLSTPVAPYQRTFQHHSRISQTASASSGDIVSMRSSIGNSGGNIGKPSLKWKSGSFTAACVDRLPRSGSIRHGVAGFINAISSDNRRSSQVCKDAVIDDDAYCVPACDSNDDASAGNLFAPVNGSRASSRMSISSTEQYAESSNTHRSLSSYIAYYIQDATAGQADPADDASELSRFMQSSCTVDPSHESSNSPTHEAPSTSAASRSATTPKSKALAALCASSSASSIHSSALGAVDRKCMAGTCSELSDNRVDSTNNADVGIESQWLATVARQDMPKQSGQAAVNQQFAPPGRTDSSRQHGKQCAHLQPPTRPDLCVRGMDEEANTPSASECAPVEYVKDDDLVPLGLRARMQSSGRVGASESRHDKALDDDAAARATAHAIPD